MAADLSPNARLVSAIFEEVAKGKIGRASCRERV